MRRALAAVPLAAAVLAAGCGGTPSSAGEFEGEERRVADQVEKLQSAGEARDASAICDDVLARTLRDAIQEAGSTCEQEMEKAIEDADDFDLDVEDVTIRGSQATARVRGSDRGEEKLREFRFEREGADWRATDLGG